MQASRVRSGAEANNKIYEKHMYEGANHAFNNDTSPRYHKEAADLAWSRTIAFFKSTLPDLRLEAGGSPAGQV